jgi:hypothetical protein
MMEVTKDKRHRPKQNNTIMIKELAEDLDEMESEMNIKREEKEEKITSEDGVVEFVCEPEDYGVIPEPQPANRVLPTWYKNLDGKMGEGIAKSTVKRCAPFLEAMTRGWIIPLPAELEFKFDEESGDFSFHSGFDKEIMNTHNPRQMGGKSNPMTQMPILKFINYWSIKVPEGYSTLLTPPMNRHEPRFRAFSGVVDCDNYFNTINAPALWTGGSWEGVIEAGTPVVQVIPFKRDNGITDAKIRSQTEKETDQIKNQSRKLKVEESDYRNNLWQAKNGSRIIDQEKSGKDTSKCPVMGNSKNEEENDDFIGKFIAEPK